MFNNKLLLIIAPQNVNGIKLISVFEHCMQIKSEAVSTILLVHHFLLLHVGIHVSIQMIEIEHGFEMVFAIQLLEHSIASKKKKIKEKTVKLSVKQISQFVESDMYMPVCNAHFHTNGNIL